MCAKKSVSTDLDRLPVRSKVSIVMISCPEKLSTGLDSFMGCSPGHQVQAGVLTVGQWVQLYNCI